MPPPSIMAVQCAVIIHFHFRRSSCRFLASVIERTADSGDERPRVREQRRAQEQRAARGWASGTPPRRASPAATKTAGAPACNEAAHLRRRDMTLATRDLAARSIASYVLLRTGRIAATSRGYPGDRAGAAKLGRRARSPWDLAAPGYVPLRSAASQHQAPSSLVAVPAACRGLDARIRPCQVTPPVPIRHTTVRRSVR
jgi:hypothetical protein